LRGYEKPESAGNTRGAAGEKVWRPKRIGNTQGAAETRGWDTKNKYSTQTKKKNMKK
jgi:hypothetical protein